MSDDVARKSHHVLIDQYMLVTGELTTGFHFYGPFKSRDKVGQWAQENLRDDTFYRVHIIHGVRDET